VLVLSLLHLLVVLLFFSVLVSLVYFGSPPLWLDNAIDVLSKTDEGELSTCIYRLPPFLMHVCIWQNTICTLSPAYVLSSFPYPAELRQTGPNPLAEFTDKLDFCKEFCTQVYADTTVLENRDFRGQIFSIY
jgi:hypothetical protein